MHNMYDDFTRLLFLHAHREASPLAHELPEESDQFRFLRDACFTNLKGEVGLIIPLDLISVFHTGSSFHPFVSSHTDPDSFPRTLSSVSCLSGT